MVSPYLLKPLRNLEDVMTYTPVEGTVSHGTLRPQDLLRSFSSELEKFKGHDPQDVEDAVTIAAYLDFCERVDARGTADVYDQANYHLDILVEALNELGPKDLIFCAHDRDRSDFGWWSV